MNTYSQNTNKMLLCYHSFAGRCLFIKGSQCSLMDGSEENKDLALWRLLSNRGDK